jgi:hypothetical protein
MFSTMNDVQFWSDRLLVLTRHLRRSLVLHTSTFRVTNDLLMRMTNLQQFGGMSRCRSQASRSIC